jgi:hypothetical protein
MIDQHIAVRDVCDRDDDGGNEKQDFRNAIEPFIANALCVRLVYHPVRWQFVDIDGATGNAIG